MGEPVLNFAFVTFVVGGGSIRGPVVGALLVGLNDALGGVCLPQLFGLLRDPSVARQVGASLASMAIHILMAAVLI